MSALFDRNAAMVVVSKLLNDPTIVHDTDNFRLTVNDFDTEFYKIVFGAIYNLAVDGAETLSPKDIDLYIGQYSKQYQTYKAEEGFEFLQSAQHFGRDIDITTFSKFYDRIKKFTVLRDLEAAGIDTKKFYNPNVDFTKMNKENEKLNETTVEKIIEEVKGRVNKVEDVSISKQKASSQKAADGLSALYEDLKSNPEIGIPLDGDILNYVVRGARFGKMYLTSAPTGHGKTRQMLGHACAISLPRIEGKEVITRKDLRPVLFVTTEQQADEIQTLIMAYVSGVNEKKILYGTASAEEEKRIQLAIKLIEEYGSNFIIETIPDPSIALIKTKIIKHIIQNHVEFIFYDYIFSSPGLLGEFRDLKVREDVALMMLSNTIKEIASEYQVFMMTGTQLNDRWETTRVRNQNQIRGSKAITDKVDIGMISVKLSDVPEELEEIKTICDTAGLPIPNMVIDIYKNRRGEYAGVKLFRYFDHGTCRAQDILLTSSNYSVIRDLGIIEYATEKVDLLDLMAQKFGGFRV
jgi:replicative DNA helicase